MGDLADYLTSNDPSFRKARLPALYSDFRPQRTLNPDGYTANLSAWRAALARLAWDAQLPDPATSTTPPRLLLTVDDALPAHLQSRQFGRPLALGTVVRETSTAATSSPCPTFSREKRASTPRRPAGAPCPGASPPGPHARLGFGNGGGGTSAAEDKMPKGTTSSTRRRCWRRGVDTLGGDAKGRRRQEGTTAAAMRLLREKKTAEATLGKRGAALLQMEEIAARIQQARDQVQFVKVMEGSAGVLKQLNAEVGGVERVEGVVDALREQMADTDEVGRILASAGEVEAIDDGEIDDELRALEKAEEDRIAAEKQAEKDAHQAKEAEATRKRLEEAGSVPETEAESEAAARTAEQLEPRVVTF
ncbi:conserved hypothetical protein [Verticillium alfalfae VaMs.102]|uniref:SNF7 family protein n=1 Tax=Verticillium alfalfae (strain VaMs.102 / ATCC MYA-4576 / FGSC 10136) TaxID=526221 RepID=C9STQ3_VERA1|nr:conserved hypothetical protein [Verticillium alfalfae VaMs.102]EEY22214.1 conserved hypothetical protein [Verticillium alfalfae VaMs.102]